MSQAEVILKLLSLAVLQVVYHALSETPFAAAVPTGCCTVTGTGNNVIAYHGIPNHYPCTICAAGSYCPCVHIPPNIGCLKFSEPIPSECYDGTFVYSCPAGQCCTRQGLYKPPCSRAPVVISAQQAVLLLTHARLAAGALHHLLHSRTVHLAMSAVTLVRRQLVRWVAIAQFAPQRRQTAQPVHSVPRQVRKLIARWDHGVLPALPSIEIAQRASTVRKPMTSSLVLTVPGARFDH